MTEADRSRATVMIAAAPETGDLMVGTGGCRKVRLAGRGKGKSGGYRLVTYLYRDGRVFLITVLSKGARANFSRAECNALAAVAKTIGD